MSKPAIDALLDRATAQQRAGRVADAVAGCRAAIDLRPKDAATFNRIGMILSDCGQFDEAARMYARALELNPTAAVAAYNMGNALSSAGRRDEAIAAYQRAVELQGDLVPALVNLSALLHGAGRIDDAIAVLRRVLAVSPRDVAAHNNLGVILQSKGMLDEARAEFQSAIALAPDHPSAYINLSNFLREIGKPEQALDYGRKAVALAARAGQSDRDRVDAANNVAIALMECGRIDEAIATCREALAADPATPTLHFTLGAALHRSSDLALGESAGESSSETGRLDEAISSFNQAIALRRDYMEAYNALANAFGDRGEAENAVATYRAALQINPDLPAIHGNLLYSLYFHPDYDAHAILKEHRAWADRHARPLGAWIKPHGNKRDPGRRLRIGYLSPNFGTHVVGWNLLPLLTHHDHTKFEIYCYSNARRPDAFTDKLRACADVWRDIVPLSDDAAAGLIRDDRIDILVDLALYMAGNRLLIFARKPAPVQVTYLGYCGTTGLEAIDYRISDPYFDEPDADCSCYSEQTWRLPRTYWSYQPGGPTPAVAALPARSGGSGGSGGHVTFGCLNTLRKVNDPVLQLWARVLGAVPGSHLLISAPWGRARQWITRVMAAGGIEASRLEFVGFQPWPAYIELFNRIDIALDPFPCNGGITTCDGLWMGVPVVTLRGQTAVGRAGSSILHNIGLAELMAESPEQYERIAVELASDLDRLGGMRSSLRDRLRGSPLMDAGQFARDVEAAYREMWRQWCAKPA